MDHSNMNHRRHVDAHLRKRVAIPEPQQPDQGPGGTKTVVQVVYVTQDQASATDNGAPVETQVVTVTPTAKPKTSVQPDAVESDVPSSTFVKSTKSTFSSATKPTHSSYVASPTTQFYNSATALGDNPTVASSPSASSAAASGSSLSVGAWAGIIGGGVAVALLLVGIIAFAIRRKQKNANYTKPEDEKGLNRLSFNDRSPASPVPMPTALTPAAAPKLQIRPMTQFDSASFLSSANATASTTPEPTKSEEKSGLRQPPPALSLNNQKNLAAGPFETPEPSPAMSAFSDNSNMSLPIQGGSAPSPVHRIMVDFKPSMADELELRSGEIVRLLHEYDDGWALCIRMDRSQQGVCPRSCLSQRPVKPRPPPGARGPPPQQNGMRGPGGPPRAQSPGGRSQSPAGSRPQSPRGPPNRAPMSPKGMPGPPRGPAMGPDSRPSSPMGRPQHPLSKVQKDDDVQYHAM